MISTKINSDATKISELSYPVLMKNITNKMIVMFFNPNEGVLLHLGNAELQEKHLGKLSTNWLEAHNREHWIEFNGSITISNSEEF